MFLCCVWLPAAAAADQKPGETADQKQQPADKADSRYRIEQGDVLIVKYRYTPEYDYTGAVPPDGMISLPIVGEVLVAGVTVDEARALIVKKAAERLRDPEVSVELKEFVARRFIVGGEVTKPGEFPLRGRITILEAIALAGGFKSSAKHSQVVLFRHYDDEHALTRILDVKEMSKTSVRVETPPLMQPGDFVFVPQNKISKLLNVAPLASLGWLYTLIK